MLGKGGGGRCGAMFVTFAASATAAILLAITAGLAFSVGLSAAASHFGLEERFGKALGATLVAAREGTIRVGEIIQDAHLRLSRSVDMFGRTLSRHYICYATFKKHCNY